MTGKVVSLSKARKAKVRADRARQADANAAKFGRTKAERKADTTRTKAEDKRLGDHRIDENGRDKE